MGGLNDSYATLAQLKLRIGETTTNNDAALTSALSAASRDLEGLLGRQFNTNASQSGTGATATYTATSLADTGANFYAAMVGQVITSTVNTATITAFTDSTHLVTTAWAPGTPTSSTDAWSIPAQVSARVYYPDDLTTIYFDDVATTTGLIVAFDFSNSGVYANVITSTNYQLEPLNGVADGTPGWAYYRLRVIQTWPPMLYTSIGYPRASVQITAQWGWPSVPAPVVEACLMLAEETWKMKEAPFGVAGFSQMGSALRVRQNPKIYELVARYDRDPVKIA